MDHLCCDLCGRRDGKFSVRRHAGMRPVLSLVIVAEINLDFSARRRPLTYTYCRYCKQYFYVDLSYCSTFQVVLRNEICVIHRDKKDRIVVKKIYPCFSPFIGDNAMATVISAGEMMAAKQEDNVCGDIIHRPPFPFPRVGDQVCIEGYLMVRNRQDFCCIDPYKI